MVGPLSELLANPAFCGPFSNFLSSTPKDGLIELWQDIQSYKKLTERLLANQARLLFNKYFGHGNKFKVELDKKLLNDLKVYIQYMDIFYCLFILFQDKILYRNPDMSTFSKLEIEVINLLNSQIPSFSSSGFIFDIFLKKVYFMTQLQVMLQHLQSKVNLPNKTLPRESLVKQ